MSDSLSAINIEQLSNAVRSVLTGGQQTPSTGSMHPASRQSVLSSLSTGQVNTLGSLPTIPGQNAAPVSFIMPMNGQVLQPAIHTMDANRLQTLNPMSLTVGHQNITPSGQGQPTIIITSQANQSAVFIPQSGLQTFPNSIQLSHAFHPQAITKTIQALPMGVQRLPQTSLHTLPTSGTQLLPASFVSGPSHSSLTQSFIQPSAPQILVQPTHQPTQVPSSVQITNIAPVTYTNRITSDMTHPQSHNENRHPIVSQSCASGPLQIIPSNLAGGNVGNNQVFRSIAISPPCTVVSGSVGNHGNNVSQPMLQTSEGGLDQLHVTTSTGQSHNPLAYQVLELLLSPNGKSGGQPTQQSNSDLKHEELIPPENGHYCVECKKSLAEPCADHSSCVQVYSLMSDTPILSRAKASLPKGLQLKTSGSNTEELGVWTKGKVPCRTMFSVLKGNFNTSSDFKTMSSHSWQIFEDGNCTGTVDCSNEEESNWLCFMKTARTSVEQNVVAYQYGKNICFITCKDIPENTELFYWYSPDYADLLDVSAQPEECHQCRICNRQLADDNDLKNHYRYVHPDTSTHKFKCTLCSRSFLSSGKLETHMFIHMGLKPHKCNICQKHFTDSSNLRMHKSIHTGERKFECTVCNRKFRQKAHMKSHMLIHVGHKKLKCQYCDKTFSRPSDVKQHTYTHTHEKSFTCEQCNRVFYKSQNYKKHMKIHSGIRDYECSDCGKSFYTKYHMDRHSKICKGEQTKKKPIKAKAEMVESKSVKVIKKIQRRSTRRLKLKTSGGDTE